MEFYNTVRQDVNRSYWARGADSFRRLLGSHPRLSGWLAMAAGTDRRQHQHIPGIGTSHSESTRGHRCDMWCRPWSRYRTPDNPDQQWNPCCTCVLRANTDRRGSNRPPPAKTRNSYMLGIALLSHQFVWPSLARNPRRFHNLGT